MATKTKTKKKLTKAQQLQREIAKRNRAFAKADAAEKRVLIAKDVIAQIKAKRYMPRSQTWVRFDYESQDALYDVNSDASMRELFLANKLDSCECCALGAMFMSCTLYNNNQTVSDFQAETEWGLDFALDGNGVTNGLHKFFSRAQLKLIEVAFEGGEGAYEQRTMKGRPASAWKDALPDDKKRLVVIMENIIENKGTFVP